MTGENNQSAPQKSRKYAPERMRKMGSEWR
jgi:hypothetical protein